MGISTYNSAVAFAIFSILPCCYTITVLSFYPDCISIILLLVPIRIAHYIQYFILS